MKIEFTKEEISELIIQKANEITNNKYEFNTVTFNSYVYVSGAVVSKEEKEDVSSS